MNLVLSFEGTGQGVQGRETNVSRLFALTAETPAQLRHLESGPGTHFGAYLFGRAFAVDAQAILSRARRWFEARYRSLPPQGDPSTTTRVYLFGFSRGALLARRFAAWLDRLGVGVAYLGLWDTVDSTPAFDVDEACPANVRRARHAVARDEFRRHFGHVPLRGPHVEEMLFPGAHSDVGGLYADNHAIADVALAWIAEAAVEEGLALVENAQAQLDASRATLSDERVFRIHDSLRLVSNFFGLLGRFPRTFGRIVRHPLCDLCPPPPVGSARTPQN